MNQSFAAKVDKIIDAASGMTAGSTLAVDRRSTRRLPYNAPIAMQFLDDSGKGLPPMLGRGHDLSTSGIKVACAQGIAPNSTGVIQLIRSNGQIALIGIVVKHCHPPIDQGGFILGLQFAPLPSSVAISDYCDEQGRLKLLDPSLRSAHTV